MGTAICPQLSPAITVLNNIRFACMTDDVARTHSGHWSKGAAPANFISMIYGLMISTISIAQPVITKKQNRKDHSSVFMHVASMVTSFRNSFNERFFRNSCIKRIILLSRKTRTMPILSRSSTSNIRPRKISAYPDPMMRTSSFVNQSWKMRLPGQWLPTADD